jgi:hypothetical protein
MFHSFLAISKAVTLNVEQIVNPARQQCKQKAQACSGFAKWREKDVIREDLYAGGEVEWG